ncbi:MAG: addiction module protein [Lewinellaceae bacterium]|nr:addiction module protein [Saprospiraceae bacterium]MCB9340683.1 addiction module protein [Lewinellaceae bacterium]
MSDLLVQIAKLSVADRIRLVQDILSTIPVEQPTDTVETRQEAELERRSRALANGKMKTVPWQNIEAELIKRYDLQP